MIALALGVVYVWAARRAGRWPMARTVAWLAGVLVLGACTALDDSELSLHMLGHVGIALVAPPLMLLGAPLRLALRASSGSTRRTMTAALIHARPLAHPLVAWTLFATATLVVHVYGLGVRNPLLHGFEHAAMFWTAVLFWMPLVGAAPVPYRLGPLAALAYLMSAMPVMVGIGMWLGGAAGDIMLGAGAVMTLAAVIGVVWPALLREEARRRAREGVAL